MAHVPDDDRRWLDDPRNVSRLVYGLYTVCAVLLFADLGVHAEHPGEPFPWEEWAPFGFQAGYGLVSCVGLVLTAKGLRRLVMRDGDYHER